jgi:hypothetical protein
VEEQEEAEDEAVDTVLVLEDSVYVLVAAIRLNT